MTARDQEDQCQSDDHFGTGGNTEDEGTGDRIAEKDLQKLTDDSCKELDRLLEAKEKELMSV